ncbi:MAG TPA: hypothetical protein VHD32_08865 [Candidatus Didemnitutus sp.]|nr:hypothetical protein [Candidatus Didemnitutus sp.]
MKTTKTLLTFIAAGLAGAAFAKLGLSSTLAYVPGTLFFAVAAGAALVGFALGDLSRKIEPLRPCARLARPNLLPAHAPSWRVAAPAREVSRERTAA